MAGTPISGMPRVIHVAGIVSQDVTPRSDTSIPRVRIRATGGIHPRGPAAATRDHPVALNLMSVTPRA